MDTFIFDDVLPGLLILAINLRTIGILSLRQVIMHRTLPVALQIIKDTLRLHEAALI